MKTSLLTQEEWFNLELELLNWSNPTSKQAYENLHFNFAQYLKTKFNPSSILELGSGMGSFLYKVNDLGIDGVGYDINQFHKQHFESEYCKEQSYNDRYILKDFTHHKTILPDVEMIVTVEVFEHLTTKQIETVLDKMSKMTNLKYVYFTSTPNSNPELDTAWGHCSIKTQEEWCEIFKKYGFSLYSNDTAITPWGIIFSKD